MIEFYFDDSGTHDASRVVAWGGIVGDSENFEYLDAKWREFLQEPSPGRPPIRMFSLSKCKAKRLPFDRYDDLAVAGARRRAVEIIINSGFSPICYGIDRGAWNSRLGQLKKTDAGSADRMAFGLRVKAVISDAKERGEKVKMHFDRGQDKIIKGIIEDTNSLFQKGCSFVEYSSLAVEDSTGLQAADTVANEFYGFSVQWIDNKDAKPNSELASIIEGAEDARMQMMGDTEIIAMMGAIDAEAH